MRWSDLLVGLVVFTILGAGSTGLVNSSFLGYEEGMENTLIAHTPNFDTVESLSYIPHTDTPQLSASEDIYTFNFSAEEGDRIHLRVTATREPHLQVLLMSKGELDEDHVNRSFQEMEEKISEASDSSTKDLRAHVTIPEDDEYSLIVRFPSRDILGHRAAGFDLIIGRGLFSYSVVRLGGYVELFLLSSFFVIVSSAGFYFHNKLKSRSSFEDKTKELTREEMKTEYGSECSSSRSNHQPGKDEEKRDSDDAQYLSYED